MKMNHVWFRSISPTEESLWSERLAEHGKERLVFLQSNRTFFVHLYAISSFIARRLQKKWGGSCRQIKPYETSPDIELNLFGKFRVQSQEIPKPDPHILWIPAEMAFGTGDHPTTAMILREIMRHKNWPTSTVLDAGCGSGILALMARKQGAKKIIAFDNDPACVRISKTNEERNFEKPFIRWKKGALGTFRPQEKFDFVLANLYSGLFQNYSKEFYHFLNPNGLLICSGILRTDLPPTIQALKKAGLKLLKTQIKRKWSMIVFCRNQKTSMPQA
jgi:ribosomal protein L11 methyltransferase